MKFAFCLRMRVALLSPLFESVPPRFYGGTERVVSNLCRGLTQAGIEVVLFASGDSSLDVPIVPVVEQALRLSRKPITDPIAYNFRMLSWVRQAAGDFDIIHNHHDYWMLPLSEMTDTPLLSTMHGRTDLSDQNSAFLSFPKAKFVSISDAQRRLLPNLPWERTIYHGIDSSQFQFSPKPGSYLAFLGRISQEKRPEWAIEIARQAGVPLKIAAKIEGQLGQEYYDAHVKKYVDGKWIQYVGEISEKEKSEFLSEALALVFPIDWPEPFGLVVVESLACGTPVLSRPCGSVPELLQEGVTGFIDLNIDRLAKRVSDIEKIDRRVCRSWVESRFSLTKMTEDYVDVYRKLIAKSREADCHRWNILHPFERPSYRDSKNQL